MQDWIDLPSEDELLKYHGFVYRITRLNAVGEEPRYYIGCKKLQSKKTLPALKGQKRKRKIVKKSDYETYYGSSAELLKDIKIHGKSNFKREVLKLCVSQWQLKYEELFYQIKENAIIDPRYYNGILNLRIGKVPKSLYHIYNILL